MDWKILDTIYILDVDTNNSSSLRLKDNNEPEKDGSLTSLRSILIQQYDMQMYGDVR